MTQNETYESQELLQPRFEFFCDQHPFPLTTTEHCTQLLNHILTITTQWNVFESHNNYVLLTTYQAAHDQVRLSGEHLHPISRDDVQFWSTGLKIRPNAKVFLRNQLTHQCQHHIAQQGNQ